MSPVRLGTKNVLAKAGSNLPASYPARLTSGRTGGGVQAETQATLPTATLREDPRKESIYRILEEFCIWGYYGVQCTWRHVPDLQL